MVNKQLWDAYPATYRASEIQTLANWIALGESCSVVGLVGCGRSNLLGFLCNRPDVLATYLRSEIGQVTIIPVELYDLPANDLSSLYRTILHAFYWERTSFAADLAQQVIDLYLENRALQDPFLVQKAVDELLALFQQRRMRIVLVLNRFDRFCENASSSMINTLRSLRDRFKDILSYIVGMQQEAVYLPDPGQLGDMYWLLDSHICWVGAMSATDAQHMLARSVRTASTPPTEGEFAALLALSGGFPSLLNAVGQWWLEHSELDLPMSNWCTALLAEDNIQYRLARIWGGLTQEEKLLLSEMQKGKFSQASPKLTEQRPLLARMAAKGVCRGHGNAWQINGELLSAYVAGIEGRVPGKIWLDEATRTIYQGQTVLDELSGLQYEILRFLIKNPRVRHTRDDIIDNAWPDEENREGITPNALQVHIAAIRKKIEPNPGTPHYLITWHGRPGGYQFYPEGKPD